MRRLWLSLIASVALMMAVSLPAEARYGLRVTPSVGKPTTTFKVSFRAPLAAVGAESDYVLEGIGPPGCASIFEYRETARRGERVVLRLTPDDDILLPERLHRRWCRGSYVAVVYWSSETGAETDRLLGVLSFGVGRSPISLTG
jgi:hypothetical protein